MRLPSLHRSVLLVLLFLLGTACGAGEQEPESSPDNATGSSHEQAEDADELEEEHAELAVHMMRVQRWTHKTALSVEARNGELTDFYVHELEETIETVRQEVPTYEGYEVDSLAGEIVVPRMEAVDRALDERDWAALDQRMEELASACNDCHAATDHGFIQIDLQDLSAPYPQRFAPGSP